MYDSIDNYYRVQSLIYDLTRWAFLFGRKDLHSFLKYDEQPLRILEIGCGTGFHLNLLNESYPSAEITGIDPSASMLNIARRRVKETEINLIQDFYQVDSFPENSFDLILCSYSLTMIPTIRQVLDAIKIHLKPNARLLVVDFDKTPSPVFSRWMKTNFVRFDHNLFSLLKNKFSEQEFFSRKVYFGLWTYSIFNGINQSSQ